MARNVFTTFSEQGAALNPQGFLRVQPWGHTPEGEEVTLFTLSSRSGLVVRVINYGGVMVGVEMAGRTGERADVTLGHARLAPYLDRQTSPYFGALIGRYANRVRDGRFSLDGAEYQLPGNDGNNHLHGGPGGFDQRLWQAISGVSEEGPFVQLSRISPDGEEGYPGTLTAEATYLLGHDDTLTISYRATTTRHCWKYTESNSRTSSESLLSDNGVNPTRSPNNTEVTRRSATGTTNSTVNGTSATTSDTTGAASNAAPHSGQNLPDPADTPHDRHTRGATRRPHSGQNFAPMGTSAAQCEQAAIDNPPAPLRRPPHHEGRRANVAARKANASVKSRQQRNHPGPTRTQETCSQARDTTHTPTDPTGPPNPIDTAPRQRPDQLNRPGFDAVFFLAKDAHHAEEVPD